MKFTFLKKGDWIYRDCGFIKVEKVLPKAIVHIRHTKTEKQELTIPISELVGCSTRRGDIRANFRPNKQHS
jgi:hypothetical protein